MKDRILFALPERPNVSIAETGRVHALTPFAFVEEGRLFFGGGLDVHSKEEGMQILSTRIESPDPPLIAIYRCLLLLGGLNHVGGNTLSELLHAYVVDQPYPGLESIWESVRVRAVPAETLLSALRVARAHGIGTRATVAEASREAVVGRLLYDPGMREFGILTPAEYAGLRPRALLLFCTAVRELTAWLQRCGVRPEECPLRGVMLCSMAACLEALLQLASPVHALGMAMIGYCAIKDIPLDQLMAGFASIPIGGMSAVKETECIEEIDAAARRCLPQEKEVAPLAQVLPELQAKNPLVGWFFPS